VDDSVHNERERDGEREREKSARARERQREETGAGRRDGERRFGAFVCFLFFEWKKGS
jgi:hypothetical protein